MNTKDSPTFDEAHFLQNTSTYPGVYQMLDAAGDVLYVGKANNLKKRLTSYFRKPGLSAKNQSLMSQVVRIETIVTHSETEALILENNLIKQFHPKYNILLRDDKTYPYIHLTDDKFARLKFYRGARRLPGRFFGPYPSAQAVKETLDIMQKVFRIRNCDNTFFKNRTRPCLQYQINRCTAPCVGVVDQATYQQQIHDAVDFLEGKNADLLWRIEQKMTAAAAEQAYETAAFYRDQLQSLRRVLEKQYITNEKGDADVIAVCREASIGAVVQVFYYRSGRSLGTQSYFPKVRADDSETEILQSFIEQIYFDKAPPKEIIVSHPVPHAQWIQNFFKDKFNATTKIVSQPRQYRAKWLGLALENAKLSIQQQKVKKMTLNAQFAALTDLLGLAQPPQLMACIDVSHTMGEATVASYVVFDQNGPKKSDYRRYNIDTVTSGDDYAAMFQALTRRFSRFKRNALLGDERCPDILFVDGGKGQFNAAKAVLTALDMQTVVLIGIAKGSDRKAGLERLIIQSVSKQVQLPSHHPALHLIQLIRDESHRFAIMGHRKKRDKARLTSELTAIEGIGEKKRQTLLQYFAGIKGVKRASVEELAKVDGISVHLAQTIYDYFHD
ncbi:excinuclease ABC subunit UvrC [Ostreibacterium oceani]|uniref:UvrABC system protein C n=1 Tax=Ostreibacterium oceani TaxID=2654998 RepID=A0A6N7F167_9GAMM|nr:excinuclease ABC subunit UvrC [Ostreibacterium oceani]MPV86538.1 excinuclease ABC subunit UvrC [Ostreibacterium oceani]